MSVGEQSMNHGASPSVSRCTEDGHIELSWLDRARDRALVFTVVPTASITVLWMDADEGGEVESASTEVLDHWIRWFYGVAGRPG